VAVPGQVGYTTDDPSLVGNDAMSIVGNLESRTLKMEAASPFETSGTVYQSTWCHIPEDLHLYQHCHENIKSWIVSLFIIEKFGFLQLTNAVGSVTVEKPQSDYRSYQNRVELMMSGAGDDEFSHVIEIYNFPSEFKTNDLCAVFSPYMKGGFEIKWVDDTHALGVFSSSLVGKCGAELTAWY
jgi:hypothetical protein